MSILFPDHVLSLSLVGLSSAFALPRHIKEFREVGEAWSAPDDESIWAECVEAIGQFVLTESEGREKVWDTVLPPLVRVRLALSCLAPLVERRADSLYRSTTTRTRRATCGCRPRRTRPSPSSRPPCSPRSRSRSCSSRCVLFLLCSSYDARS